LDRPQLAREVRERDYFLITSFALWGVWVGMGLATLMEWAAEWLEQREPDRERRWRYATPLLLLALIPLAGNRLPASRAGPTLAPVAQTDGPAAQLQRRAARRAPAGLLPRAEDHREPGRRRRDARSGPAQPPIPREGGRDSAAGDPRPVGEAADLFLAHRRAV